ncbi:MAG: protein kinase [Chlamydiales bacterium]|nr:protein kinase [Chlamydiales bacterium]
MTTLLKPLSKPSNQQKTILHVKTIDSILSIKGKPLNSLETLATKVIKVIKNCFNQLPKLFGQFKTTLSAKTIDPIVSLKNKVLSPLETLAAKVEKVTHSCLTPLIELFEQFKTILQLKALDPTLSLKEAYEVLDWSLYLVGPEASNEDWNDNSPTSTNNLSHSHVIKVDHQTVAIERNKIGEGGGKLVNFGFLLKIDHLAKYQLQKVAVLRPLYKMSFDDITLDEENVQALQCNNTHLEPAALYTGKTYDPALLQKHKENPDVVPIVNQYIIKPYLQPLDQLTDLEDRLQAMLDIAKSINYLHKHDLVHRDIKPENMMYTNKSNGKISAKLIDLGQLHNINNDSENTFPGTEYYIAPEIQESSIHTKASDMYAFGLSIQRVIEPLKSSNASPVLKQMENLAQRLISEDPKMRPTAEDTYKELKSIKLNNYS